MAVKMREQKPTIWIVLLDFQEMPILSCCFCFLWPILNFIKWKK